MSHVNATAIDGRTDTNIVEDLLKISDIHMEAPRFYNWTARHCAARFGHFSIATPDGGIGGPSFEGECCWYDPICTLRVCMVIRIL